MEISPVAGLRIAPVIRSTVTDLGLTDVYEVERSSRAGDETYTPSGANAATGFEDDEDDYSADEVDETDQDPINEKTPHPSATSSINVLA
jgi:hypothetical protein